MQDASRIDRSAAGGKARCDGAWRLSRLWGVFAVCAWACASAPAQQAAEIVVRLLPSAVVSGETVTLADVAEVRGESAHLAARMDLGAAPHIGRSGVVELAQVQAMLARRGVNLSNWVFRGASRCTVQRVGTTGAAEGDQDAPSASPRAADPSPSRPTTRPAEGTEASRAAALHSDVTRPVDPGTLEGRLRAYLARRLAGLGGAPLIRFSPGAARALALANPTYDFRIETRSDRLLGMVPLEVTVIEGGQTRQTLPIIAEVSLRATVVVAARPINNSEIIRTSHLLLEERTFERVEDIGLFDTAALVGQRARHFIAARAVLSGRDIEPMPLILANDLVTVLVRRGGLTIRGSAKALSAGGLGDTVRLRNEMSREVFCAVVTGQKTAEAREGLPGTTAGTVSGDAFAAGRLAVATPEEEP